MKSNYLLYLLVLITIFCVSCSSSVDFRKDADPYTVVASKLNVRQQASTNAHILGKLRMGDTVYAKKFYKKWKKILYRKQLAYVDSTYLTKIVIKKYQAINYDEMNLVAKSIIQFIDKYSNWRTWEFWILTIVLLITSYYLFIIGTRMIRGDDAVDFWVDHGFMGINYLPYITFIVGFFFGIVYFFWPEDIQKALFLDPFWLLPFGKGFLCWYIWILGLITLISIFVFSIYDIITFKSFSIVRILYFLILSCYIFISMIFLVNASIIIFLAGLALEFILSIFIGSAPISSD